MKWLKPLRRAVTSKMFPPAIGGDDLPKAIIDGINEYRAIKRVNEDTLSSVGSGWNAETKGCAEALGLRPTRIYSLQIQDEMNIQLVSPGSRDANAKLIVVHRFLIAMICLLEDQSFAPWIRDDEGDAYSELSASSLYGGVFPLPDEHEYNDEEF